MKRAHANSNAPPLPVSEAELRWMAREMEVSEADVRKFIDQGGCTTKLRESVNAALASQGAFARLRGVLELEERDGGVS